MEGPGYLAVAIQPGWNTEEQIFEDWYREEHGPLRLRLPFIETGNRYRAADGQKPTWSAVYDVAELSWLEKRIYTRLREERSMREKAVMNTFESIDRKIYSIISNRGAYGGPAPVMIAVSMRLHETDLAEFNTWYEREQTDSLAKIPGWIRTRRFRMVAGGAQGMPSPGEVECLAVHEFRAENGLNGPEHRLSQQKAAKTAFMEKVMWKEQRMWIHHLTFEPMSEPPSTVVTTDSAALQYQLEGKPSDPVIVCVNSILTSLRIWDNAATALISGAVGRTYRVLRYNPRGFSAWNDRSNHSSFDLLADDLEYLLSRLNIDKVHAVVGVSMGGVTAINFTIKYPQMLEKYVACDCNVSSSVANSRAWAERIELSRDQGMSVLADETVTRWFTKPNHDSDVARRVWKMISGASREGFELNALALCDFDLRPELRKIETPGLLVVGEEDGKLPQAMSEFGIPNSSLLKIPNAGHLPMLENHDAFIQALTEFL